VNLILENIGIIKKADILFNGLTVIAGENDSGKSTVGKVLLSMIKSDQMALSKHKNRFVNNREHGFNVMIELLFEGFLKQIKVDSSRCKLFFDKHNFLDASYDQKHKKYIFSDNSVSKIFQRPFRDVTYIQTPLIWDLENFFSAISQFKEQIAREEKNKKLLAFDFKYPYILWDLYGKFIKKRNRKVDIYLANEIADIIDGEFEQFSGSFVFKRDEIIYPLIQTAHGIKSFGVLQILIKNGHLNKYNFLIIDEPEVHLHPKWEIKYAEIIVKLVLSGVNVLLTSHSPYFLEAIYLYSKKYHIQDKTNFYLAENELIEKQENLENIFYKLSLPMQELKNLKRNLR